MDVSRMGDKLVIARLLENPANPTETVTERCDPGRSNDRVCLLIAYDPDEKDRETPVSRPLESRHPGGHLHLTSPTFCS